MLIFYLFIFFSQYLTNASSSELMIISKYNSHEYGPADSIMKVRKFIDSDKYKKSEYGIIYLPLQITKDGIPVVCSHSNLSVFPGFNGFVKDYSFEELQKLDLGYNFDPYNEYPLRNKNIKIQKLSIFIAEIKPFLSDKSNNLVIFDLKDSSLSQASTLYLLAEYFDEAMLNNITFNSKHNRYKNLLSYYNYLYSNKLPVVCEINLSSIIDEHKSKTRFTLPTANDYCTKHGSVIINFDYDNLSLNAKLTTKVLLKYIQFLNKNNPDNNIFLDIHYNIHEHFKKALERININGIIIDSDFNDTFFSLLDIEEIINMDFSKITAKSLKKPRFMRYRKLIRTR